MGGLANIADWRVTLDGKDLTDRIAPRLLTLRLTEKRGGEADQLDLEVTNHDGRLTWPKTGAALTVQLGWRQGKDVRVGLIDKGRYIVDEVALQGPPDIYTIRARSADLTAGYRVRKDDAYHNTTIGEIVAKVAAANGLKPACAEALAGIAVPVLGQTAQSDMALVRDLGRRYDAVATIKAGKLIFAPIGAGTTPTGKPIANIAISVGDGDTYRMSEVQRDAYAGVSASWHDQDAAKRKTVEVGGDDGTRKHLKRTYASEADAKAAASAEWNRIQRGAAQLEMALALGRPDIFPEAPTTLTGFPDPIQSRKWLVSEATHSLDGDRGLMTQLKLETAA